MGDCIHVRPATAEDRSAVQQLLEASYPVLLRHYDAALMSEAMPLLTTPDERLLGSAHYYIAEDGGTAVGCGGWSLDPPPGADDADDAAVIRRFAVLPELSRSGIGSRLFEQCERAIQELPIRRMIVRSSLNAEPFYAAIGFRPLRPIQMPLPSGRGLPCVLMERKL